MTIRKSEFSSASKISLVRSDDDKRGDVIAAGNLVDCFLGIMSVVLQGGMMWLGISPQWQCGILACTSALIAVFIIRNMRRM